MTIFWNILYAITPILVCWYYINDWIESRSIKAAKRKAAHAKSAFDRLWHKEYIEKSYVDGYDLFDAEKEHYRAIAHLKRLERKNAIVVSDKRALLNKRLIYGFWCIIISLTTCATIYLINKGGIELFLPVTFWASLAFVGFRFYVFTVNDVTPNGDPKESCIIAVTPIPMYFFIYKLLPLIIEIERDDVIGIIMLLALAVCIVSGIIVRLRMD